MAIIESERTKKIKSLYKDETKYLGFEEKICPNGQKIIRTYLILDNGFDDKLKLEDLGYSTNETKLSLMNMGYRQIIDGKLTDDEVKQSKNIENTYIEISERRYKITSVSKYILTSSALANACSLLLEMANAKKLIKQ